MKNLAALVGGVVFGFGLLVSGMANPENVLAFLRLNENWSPALMLVMGSALAVAAIGFRLARRNAKPLWAESFHIPASSTIDARLVAGAALFGVGWGLSGYCPGPALVGALQVDARALAFLASFLVGVGAYELLTAYRAKAPAGLAAEDG